MDCDRVRDTQCITLITWCMYHRWVCRYFRGKPLIMGNGSGGGGGATQREEGASSTPSKKKKGRTKCYPW